MSVKKDNNWEPVILAFCCNWCTYTGADLAGLNRMKYPENVRVIRVPCSRRAPTESSCADVIRETAIMQPEITIQEDVLC